MSTQVTTLDLVANGVHYIMEWTRGEGDKPGHIAITEATNTDGDNDMAECYDFEEVL